MLFSPGIHCSSAESESHCDSSCEGIPQMGTTGASSVVKVVAAPQSLESPGAQTARISAMYSVSGSSPETAKEVAVPQS